MFLQQILPDFDDIVLPNPNELAIERRVMELAERESVGHDWITARLPIRDYVSRIQQLLVPNPAERALLPIGMQHAFPEALLVQALSEAPGCIGPSDVIVSRWQAAVCDAFDETVTHHLCVVNGHAECETQRTVPNNEDGPRSEVLATHNAVEVNERYATSHRVPEPCVVWVVRIRASVPVAKLTVSTEFIIVRP